MAEAVLTAEGLAKFYGSKLVFKGVDLAMRAGEVWLVAGPNGAGKSTLLKVLAGLSPATAGSVRTAPAPERIAYLGHATCLYPGLTALGNLAFWARMYGIDARREGLMALLERVGLEHAAEERAQTFSRGMAQRLNLARVYMVRPELLFLDEPGTGLDPASLAALREDIRALAGTGAAIAWVSHHVAEDAALADNALLLADRGMAYSGPAAGLPQEAAAC